MDDRLTIGRAMARIDVPAPRRPDVALPEHWDDMGWVERVQWVIDHVTFMPDWSIKLLWDPMYDERSPLDLPGLNVRIGVSFTAISSRAEPNEDGSKPMCRIGIKRRVPVAMARPNPSLPLIMESLRQMLIFCVTHEVDEFLEIGGQRWNDPHRP